MSGPEPPRPPQAPAGPVVFVVNDAPYASERGRHALKLALALRRNRMPVRLFLMGDAVAVAKLGQEAGAPERNLETLLLQVLAAGAEVRLCDSCLDRRGLTDDEIVNGVWRCGIDEFAAAVAGAGRVVTF